MSSKDRPKRVLFASVLFVLVLSASAAAPPKPGSLARPASSVAPLAAGQTVAWSHGPFEAGDCSICHERKDPKSPGRITGPVNELCLTCHEEMRPVMQRRVRHAPALESCTICHNPHNAPEKKLLVAETVTLCTGCHDDVKGVTDRAPVKHGAMTTGAKCASCHNPHAANVEKLLIQLPYDLCVSCHGRDDMLDDENKRLQNIKQWIDQNPVRHGPVAAKDCSACHRPHGGEHFRLLVADYPPSFYSGFDPANYELCFKCHNQRVVQEPETTTLTGFRDGARNLHYLHVNKPERGRTCRACHEVHASSQAHHIREGVPYGSRNWILKLNFKKTPQGGECARTCHDTKTYSNGPVAVSSAEKP